MDLSWIQVLCQQFYRLFQTYSEETESSAHPFTNIRLLVFDFDCTITNFHLCMTLTLDEILTAPLNEMVDFHLFRSFIDYLERKNIDVAIASYGYKNIILTLMDRIFGNDQKFDQKNVITPKDISVRWKECTEPPRRLPLSKNNMLNLLAERYHLRKEEIHLLDDTEANVIKAIGEGYGGTVVPKAQGFKEVLRALLKKFLQEEEIDKFIESLK